MVKNCVKSVHRGYQCTPNPPN